jgi:hypothetical protein
MTTTLKNCQATHPGQSQLFKPMRLSPTKKHVGLFVGACVTAAIPLGFFFRNAASDESGQSGSKSIVASSLKMMPALPLLLSSALPHSTTAPLKRLYASNKKAFVAVSLLAFLFLAGAVTLCVVYIPKSNDPLQPDAPVRKDEEVAAGTEPPSETDQSQPPKEQDGLLAAKIAGGVVGGLLIVGGVVALCVYFGRRNAGSHENADLYAPQSPFTSLDVPVGSSSVSSVT